MSAVMASSRSMAGAVTISRLLVRSVITLARVSLSRPRSPCPATPGIAGGPFRPVPRRAFVGRTPWFRSRRRPHRSLKRAIRSPAMSIQPRRPEQHQRVRGLGKNRGHVIGGVGRQHFVGLALLVEHGPLRGRGDAERAVQQVAHQRAGHAQGERLLTCRWTGEAVSTWSCWNCRTRWMFARRSVMISPRPRESDATEPADESMALMGCEKPASRIRDPTQP